MSHELRRWLRLVETDDAVDVRQSWKVFDQLPDDRWVMLYHATSLSAARLIMATGFKLTERSGSDTAGSLTVKSG